MRILYISSKKSWRGVVTWMKRTAIGLQKNGHDVWILTHKNSALAKNSHNKVNIIKENLGPDYNILKILKLVYFVKKNNIDLILTNIEKEIGIGGIAAKICKIPNIRRIGREDDFFRRFKTKINHKYLVSHSIVPCNYVSDKILEGNIWLNKNEFTTIYNGREPFLPGKKALDEVRNRLNISDDKNIIGITTRLHKIKYVNHLIKAFKTISAEYPNWILLITGDGTEKWKLKEMVENLSLQEKVIFNGFTENPMLISSLHDISILTSKLEGFSNSIVEYFAVGNPVVATDVGGVREIIKDGENGFLYPFGNINSLIDKISTLIESVDLRLKFKENALNTLKNNFTESKMIEDVEEFFMSRIK